MKVTDVLAILYKKFQTYGDFDLGVMVEAPDGKTYIAIVKGCGRATLPGIGQCLMLTTEKTLEAKALLADPENPHARQPWLDPTP